MKGIDAYESPHHAFTPCFWMRDIDALFWRYATPEQAARYIVAGGIVRLATYHELRAELAGSS